jgi:DNA-binding NarL/FixJ family response regulator
VRVVIADDEVLLCAGITRLLEDAGITVLAQLSDARDLVGVVQQYRPDVAIVDVQMPPGRTDDGLRAAIETRRLGVGTGVLALSNALEERALLELIGEDASGVGYLLKERIGDVDAFLESVRRVADGGSALDPEVVATMVRRRHGHHMIETLTPREQEVLGLMAEGRSNQGIANALGVTAAAVEKHVTGVFAKLGLSEQPYLHPRVMAVLERLRP